MSLSTHNLSFLIELKKKKVRKLCERNSKNHLDNLHIYNIIIIFIGEFCRLGKVNRKSQNENVLFIPMEKRNGNCLTNFQLHIKKEKVNVSILV